MSCILMHCAFLPHWPTIYFSSPGKRTAYEIDDLIIGFSFEELYWRLIFFAFIGDIGEINNQDKPHEFISILH